MHSGNVNGYQLLCNAHTVLELHLRELQLFSFLLSIVLFHFFFLCVYHSDSPFLGASLVCVNNLKRTADLVL